jgi:hypothetical protein
MIWDGAGWHKGGSELEVPDNIVSWEISGIPTRANNLSGRLGKQRCHRSHPRENQAVDRDRGGY